MVSVLDEMQRRALAQALDDGLKQLHVRQLVARSLKEQHRNVHVEEMRGTFFRRTLGRMQGETNEGQASDAGQRRCRLRLRRHTAAEGLAAGNEGEFGHEPGRFARGSANRRVGKLGRVRPPGTLLHIRKLVAQGGDAALSELCRHHSHERMSHSGPCPMREKVARARPRRHQQQGRDAVRIVDDDGHWLCV